MIDYFGTKKADPKPDVAFAYSYARDYAGGLVKRGVLPRELLAAYTSWVFTCVTIRAEAVAKTDFYTFTKKGDMVERLPEDHPAQQVIDAPNPFMSKWLFQFYLSCFLDLLGYAYAYIARDRLAIPRQLWLLPPDKMTIVPGKTPERMIDKYILNWGQGVNYTFPQEDVLHLRQPNPQSFIEGFSPTEAASYMIDTNMAQIRFLKNIYEKDATPDGVITTDQTVERGNKEEFLQRWIEWFGGSEKKRRVGFLDQGTHYEPVGYSPREMELWKNRKEVRSEVFGMYRVPLAKAGMEEKLLARAAAESMDYQFYNDVVEPRCIMMQDQIQLDLMAVWFDRAIKVGHETVIPTDTAKDAQIMDTYLKNGTLTRNEVRNAMDFEDVEGGDEILVPNNYITLSAALKGKPKATANNTNTEGAQQ